MDTFPTLAEPNRRKLLDALVAGPQTVNQLVGAIGMSQPVVSKHLRVLRDANLVHVTPDGQRRLYRLNPAPLVELDAWLEPYRALWAGRLDALEAQLHARHNGPGETS